MRRGDIWTVAGGKDYAGKPRPVVIVQDDSFDATESITICAFTTDETDAPLFRLLVEPNAGQGPLVWRHFLRSQKMARCRSRSSLAARDRKTSENMRTIPAAEP